MLKYHLGWLDDKGKYQERTVGKRLRPTLCLFACEAVGGDYHRALPIAAAIELIHNFSLIHDDIQDGDIQRHHRPTVWYLWGKEKALYAGNAMHILANLALKRVKGVSYPLQLQLTHLLEESCLEMIIGQFLDVSYESRMDISVEAYLEMIKKKTAALIACSLKSGAMLGTNATGVIDAFYHCGQNLGIAFQIKDDILGIWGDEVETGKPLASDIKRKKKSLPIVYALERAQGKVKEEMKDIYQGEIGEREVTAVLGILNCLHAHQYAQRLVEEYSQRAVVGLKEVKLSSRAQREMEEIVHFLVGRRF
jgi:geranylgeranyl diphosphate synthase type I